MAIFKGSGVAIVTPFHEDESINYDMLDQLIVYQVIKHIIVNAVIFMRALTMICLIS